MQTDRTNCAMCGKPIAAWRLSTSVLCESPSCAFQFKSLPADKKCVICTRPVPPSLRADRYCGDLRCRHTLFVSRPLAAAKRAHAEMMANAPTYRAAAAAALGMAPEDGESYLLSVIPQNLDQVQPLPMSRRLAFEAHLRAKLAGARERLASAPPTMADDAPAGEVTPASDEPMTPRKRAELAILGAGCGTCRGQCCRGGGDHAYHGEDSMARYLGRFPAHDDDAVVADYLAFVPSATMSEGCIYQRDDGCALPREMRAEICNAFHCTGLTMIRHAYRDGRPVRAFFLHHDGTSLFGGSFVEIPDAAE